MTSSFFIKIILPLDPILATHKNYENFHVIVAFNEIFPNERRLGMGGWDGFEGPSSAA